ncbi:hypothetical protein ACFQGE_13440 [Halomicroarcula sp. GCM10025817]|uniref:hypothetical protein n=1 Tax=Haloarcula TaxID=2237 RepID=UPI0023E83003|nr:hypothetical protein [Halomicroarcula sp. SYNS111]
MEWRCEWCGKPHEENDPPCDNCGHGTYERAVRQVNEEVVEGGAVWVCQDCGREHVRNRPPCRRCGGSDFERRVGPPESDPLDEIATSWRDVIEPKYVLGYLAVAALLALIVATTFGFVSLPGFGTDAPAAPPAVPDAPGSADVVEGLDLAATEEAYVAVLNERRGAAGASTVSRNATADEAAAYYNKARVDARYGGGEGPDREAFAAFDLACSRPSVVAYEVAFDRTPQSVADFDDETAFATALVDSYAERGAAYRPAETGTVGVDVHVAPDGRVFVTHVVC